jgi:hypothetical protein
LEDLTDSPSSSAYRASRHALLRGARTGVLWRWLGWLGTVRAVTAFVAGLGILDDDPEDISDTIGFVTFIGLPIWVVATGIGMLMKSEEPMPVVDRAMN